YPQHWRDRFHWPLGCETPRGRRACCHRFSPRTDDGGSAAGGCAHQRYRQNLSSFASQLRGFAPDVVLDMFPYTEEDAALVTQTFRGVSGRVVAVSSMV